MLDLLTITYLQIFIKMENKIKNINSYNKFVDLMDNILSLTEEIKANFNEEFSHKYSFENSLKIRLDKK